MKCSYDVGYLLWRADIISALSDADKAKELSKELRSQINIDFDTNAAAPDEATDIENLWKRFRDSILNVASEVLGFVERKHQDWFDNNDEEIESLLNAMHLADRNFIGNKQSSSQENLPGKQTIRTEMPETHEEQVVGS